MTVHSLITAVTVGVAAGLAGRFLVCRRRPVPWWLPVAAGVAAAVLVTVVAPFTVERGPRGLQVALQVLFAAAAVTAVALTVAPGTQPETGARTQEGRADERDSRR